ncbi:hypothetical protein AA103587_2458 [Gluconobacter kanchanaburiensis NBRC 103587]|nr:hypothetical protein AA103587_2458 [Gluconobacter kanchanaburiensis NBRC 103587]
MDLEITLDRETPEGAGMGGHAQIESITDSATGDDLTSSVDQGLFFPDEDPSKLEKYLKEKFGDDVTYSEI